MAALKQYFIAIVGTSVDFCFSSSFISYPSASTDRAIDEPQVVIRAIEPRDIKGLAEVLAHSFHSRRGLWYWFYPLLRLGIYEDLRSRLRSTSPDHRCLVASKVVNSVTGSVEEIVGTAEISIRSGATWSDRFPYISNVAVSYTHRRQGIARKLLIGCEQIAQEWGCQEVSLHVLENNYSAKRLYFATGYRLRRIEFSFMSWLLQRPRRLLLHKKMPPKA
jgi:ribosomal protein S18 acetylase RimI-like enzyme